MSRLAYLIALAGWVGILHPAAAAHAQVGTPVSEVELATLGGGRARLLGDAVVNVLVFFRPDQERSLGTLKDLGECQKGLSGKPVQWAAIVSSSVPRDAAAALAGEARLPMPVLVDEGDALYGSLGVALHPVIVIIDANHRLAAFEPFRAINYCIVVTARIRRVLGEISDQELAQALSPPRAQEGGNGEIARRYRALAEALFKTKNYDKALENVRKSIEKDPGLAAAHALLGAILAAQGNCADAVHAFRRALELDSGNASAQDGLQHCKG